MQFKALGQPTTGPSKELETFPTPDAVTQVRFDCHELTSFCPVTNQPDFSQVVIEYGPKEKCIESKSLKLYLWSFREEPLFGEQLASQISADIFKAVEPHWVRVELVQNIRGGMQLTAVAERGDV